MPEVFRERGLRFFFYSNEGQPREPCHVHVETGSGEAKVWVEPTVTLADNDGLSSRDLKRALETARRRRREILEAWNEHLGG